MPSNLYGTKPPSFDVVRSGTRRLSQKTFEKANGSSDSFWVRLRSEYSGLSKKLKQIADFLTESPTRFVRMTSKEICEELNLSEPTLIRFGQMFGFAGISELRIAIALDQMSSGLEAGLFSGDVNRRRLNQEGKTRIAKAAMQYVQNHRSLLLDNGSTLEIFADELSKQGKYTIMTNGLVVAQNALRNPNNTVLLTGGMIVRETSSLSGRMVEGGLSNLVFELLVMSADTIGIEHGLSAYSEAEAYITRAMVDASAKIIVLADHSKFLESGLHRICALDAIDLLITDEGINPDLVDQLRGSGVEVVVA